MIGKNGLFRYQNLDLPLLSHTVPVSTCIHQYQAIERTGITTKYQQGQFQHAITLPEF